MERLHIIVDQQLPAIYSCVQAGHAVAQWMIENPKESQQWNNNYLIYLKSDLLSVMEKLEERGVQYTEFKEPDLDNQVTAIAVLGNGEAFKKLKLVGN